MPLGSNEEDGQMVKDDKETKPSLPPRIPLKWPLTRAERCEELDKLASLYNNEQKANILAAKAYHRTFPPEELVLNEKVSFCHGQKIDRSPARLEGPIWSEGPNFIWMTGRSTASSLSPLRSASNTTTKAPLPFYTRDAASHLYKLVVEIRAPSTIGGNGSIFVTDVSYDSGCSALAMPISDLSSLLTPGGFGFASSGNVLTAGGQVQSVDVSLELRVLTSDGSKEILPWHWVNCSAIDDLPCRLFSTSLEEQCFIANHPYRQRLYVACSRA